MGNKDKINIQVEDGIILRRQEFIDLVASRSGVSKKLAKTIFDEYEKILRASLKSGISYRMKGVGDFTYKTKKGREVARDMVSGLTGQVIHLPVTEPSSVITFRPNKALAREIRDITRGNNYVKANFKRRASEDIILEE